MARDIAALDVALAAKKKDAIGALRNLARLLVALSGGVDSAVLLAIAREALGPDRLVAVTGRSAAVTSAELSDAETVAQALGVTHVIVDTRELDRPEYRENAGDRCFHCRTELFELLAREAVSRRCDAIAYGAIVDDLGDHRPGMAAARKFGVLAPLLDAKICKNEVRILAKHYELHISEKPAAACLASRIPVGTEVTPERLAQVERAEAALLALGFRRVRVRHHGEIARVEVDADELMRCADPALRAAMAAGVREAGFKYATLDLEGYREGGASRPVDRGLYSIGPQRDVGQ
jgi:uncharacterized protein